MRVLSITLIALLCLLQYKLWFSGEGIVQTLRLNYQIHHHQQINYRLSGQNQALAQDIHQLKSNANIEALAREEIGMVKKNETYYQFVH